MYGHAGVKSLNIGVYGHDTWWVGSTVNANKFEGHFKVIEGQMAKHW